MSSCSCILWHWREGEREGEKEAGREGGRERGRERGREGGREGGRREVSDMQLYEPQTIMTNLRSEHSSVCRESWLDVGVAMGVANAGW